ncbi:putative secreted protein (Por secretion system target) [Flavobacteriaceae bacterium MAR_2010_105]|nr:putative secreted protein (Por secretion system target) [Flavobacteriaceae bacterium MAR_2010_105]
MKQTLLILLLSFFLNSTLIAQIAFTKHTINASTGTGPYTIDSGLLDGDAFNDIVIGTETGSTLEWYKNNGDGTFTIQTAITHSLTTIYHVAIADLDGINGNDIIAAGYINDKLVWFPNNGDGTFGAEQLISNSIDGAIYIVTGTIDAGATIDVAVAAYDSGNTVWFSNDGTGSFTGPNTIAADGATSPGSLDLADFDGDGDLDAVIANSVGGTVKVYDNRLIPDGSVSFNEYTNTVETNNGFLFSVSFVDVNDDGVLDILKSNTSGPNTGVAFYTKDSNGASTTFTEHPLTSTISRPSIATMADLDNNLVDDLIVVNAGTLENAILWHEITANATSSEFNVDVDNRIVYGITVNDFDNDGDLDIASVEYQSNDLNWFENNWNTLGINENNLNSISIYPNPTKSELNFKGLNQTVDVIVYDIIGKNVLNESLDINTSLDVSKLHSGIYILKFKGIESTYKFVKQ